MKNTRPMHLPLKTCETIIHRAVAMGFLTSEQVRIAGIPSGNAKVILNRLIGTSELSIPALEALQRVVRELPRTLAPTPLPTQVSTDMAEDMAEATYAGDMGTYVGGESSAEVLTDPDSTCLPREPVATVNVDETSFTYLPSLSASPETRSYGAPVPGRPICGHCLSVVGTIAGPDTLRCQCGRSEVLRDEVGPPQRALSSSTFGRYELLGELGAGGMGVVYRARQPLLDREVALKVLKRSLPTGSSARRRFMLEAEAAAGLTHPGIVNVYEVGEIDGQPFYSMDLVEGSSLCKHVDKTNASPRDVARIVLDVARAVEHFHQNGILHRDLKPENVVVGEHGPKIIDFGIAKRVSDTSSMTMEGELLGTLRYMSPEQAAGSVRDLDARTDVYAIGAILYKLLSGKAPFADLRNGELFVAVQEHEPESLRQLEPLLDEDMVAIVQKAMCKRRERRYRSAAELAVDLESYVEGQPLRVARARSEAARAPLAMSVLSGVTLGLAVALVASLILRPTDAQASGPGLATAASLNSAAELRAELPPLVTERELPFTAERRLKLQQNARDLFGALPHSGSPAGSEPSDEVVQLGRTLFHDTLLSENRKVSCNTCHPLDRFGADGDKTSMGFNGKRGNRNTPSVFNAALNVAQFWDGRAGTLEDQATGPILNLGEMGLTEEVLLKRLAASKPYQRAFKEAFPEDAEPVSLNSVGVAIAAYEKQLMTPSRLDDFIQNDERALRDEELRGLELFSKVGCTTCHVGPGVGGTMFQRLGLFHPYQSEDSGRYEVTKISSDRNVFKVPVLRNVAKTGPYLHDGSVSDLGEVVRLMAWHQLGKKLPPADVNSIVAFLKSLTGRVDHRMARAPRRQAD